ERGVLREPFPPDGPTTDYDYDARGILARVTIGLGDSTFFTHGRDNRLVSSTDARGNTTAYEYDARDNLTRITYADGTFETYGYEAHGPRTGWANAQQQP